MLRSPQGRGFSTWTSTRLDDKDILSSHAFFNLNPSLSNLELAKKDLCGRYAKVVADSPARLLADQTFSAFAHVGAYSVNCGCELPPRMTILRTMTPVVGLLSPSFTQGSGLGSRRAVASGERVNCRA
jgi:hypothetical protein